jgi:hypothetical protein
MKKRAPETDDDQPELLPAGTPPDRGTQLDVALTNYRDRLGRLGKGEIATLIYASRLARINGLPFDITHGIRTEKEGQVKGLGRSSVQKILSAYGIEKVLAKEGGRTSRGSLGNIRKFLEFLNSKNSDFRVDAAATEAWWVREATVFFNAAPFSLRFNPGQSLRSVIGDLIVQAKQRQTDSNGVMFVGAMLQHLVGAKLTLALPAGEIEHHGFSVADAPNSRGGDFDIGSASIHVTTAPSESLIRKCQANINSGRQPLIVTVKDMVPAAEAIAQSLGLHDRIDVLDAEQFIATNLHEFGCFQSDKTRMSVGELVTTYNQIIDKHETDPSLKIAYQQA